jgi:hypothetical protein
MWLIENRVPGKIYADNWKWSLNHGLKTFFSSFMSKGDNEWVIGRLLFNAKWKKNQLYHGENKLPFNEILLNVLFVLDQLTP